MMNIAHLWWIIPLAFIVGYMVCACLAVGKRADERMDQIMKDKEVPDDH